METAGNIIIAIGALFMLFGVIGIFKFNNFYTRILLAAKIDTVGTITIIIGIAVRHGFSFFSLKAFLLLGIMIIIIPLASHLIARSAYMSGFQTENHNSEEKKEGDYDEETVWL